MTEKTSVQPPGHWLCDTKNYLGTGHYLSLGGGGGGRGGGFGAKQGEI